MAGVIAEQTPEQKAGIRNTLVVTVGIIGLVLGLFVNSFTSPKSLSEEEMRGLGYYGFPQSREIKPFNLVDHNGGEVGVEDLGLAMDTAEGSRSSVPMGALAKNLYRIHQQQNDAGQLDFSSIQLLYRPALKD